MFIEQKDLEILRGKSTPEVISSLPQFLWFVEQLGRRVEVRLAGLHIVDYDIKSPKDELDFYDMVPVTPSVPIVYDELYRYLAPKPKRAVGLTSIVDLDPREFETGAYGSMLDAPQAHLPLIDLDLKDSALSQREALELIKQEIPARTEITQGVILGSGRENCYHFVGIGRLLTEAQLPAFLGMCLLMGREGRRLVNTRWVGHSLTPMKYMKEDQESKSGSVYDSLLKFATLRILSNKGKPFTPTVVDVL